MRVDLVGAYYRNYDLGLVAITVGERGPQGPVDQAGCEYGTLRRPPFTAEERPGYLAGSVHSLLDVNREREEINAFRCVWGGVSRSEDEGVPDPPDYRALGLLCQAGPVSKVMVLPVPETGAETETGSPI